MADKFRYNIGGLESPPTRIAAVTPDDGADLAHVSRCLNTAESGTVRITTLGGTTETVTIAAGIVFPVRAVRVWSTGTTATGIVAMF